MLGRNPVVGLGLVSLLVSGLGAESVAAQGLLPIPRSATSGDVSSLDWGDLDGDGDLDLVATYYEFAGDGFFAWFLNDGDGRFEEQGSIGVDVAPFLPVRLGDLDNDGDLDAFVAIQGSCSILVNDGAGGFSLAGSFSAGQARGIAVADLNGDQYADVVTLKNANTSVYLNNQDGTFSTGVNYYSPGVGTIDLVDLDGDSDLDMVTCSVDSSDGDYRFINNGQGGFGPRQAFAPGERLASPAILDLNGDGAPDLVAVDALDTGLILVLNNGSGVFGGPVKLPMAEGFEQIIAMDFDRDGRADVVGRDEDGALRWMRSMGDGTLGGPVDTGARSKQGVPGFGRGPFAADVDGNGIDDLISVLFANYIGDAANYLLTHLRSEQGGYIGADFERYADPEQRFSRFEDLNADGYPDMVGVPDDADDVLDVRLSNPDGSPGPTQRYTFDQRDVVFTLADHDGDGDVDLFLLLSDDPVAEIGVMRNDGSGLFGAPETLLESEFWITRYTALEAGDVDGDGVMDLVLTTRANTDFPEIDAEVEVRLGNGAGQYPLASVEEIGAAGVSPIRLFDQDGDGDLDVLLRGMFIEIGAGGIQSAFTSLSMGDQYLFADLDGDGLGDVVSSWTDLSVFWGAPGGGFLAPVSYESGLTHLYAAIFDADGDGVNDLVTSGDGLAVLRSTGVRQFELAGRYAYDRVGFLRPLQVIDLDADGDDEILITDRGAQWVYGLESAGCSADLTGDGVLNFFDVSAFLSAYNTQDPAADFTGDGLFNFFDVSAFLSAFNAGCP